VSPLRFFTQVKLDLSRAGESTMSFTMFLALCVLGLGFIIYALFQWTYGDKRRSALARQLVAQKKALKEQSPRPVLVAHKGSPLDLKSHWHTGTRSQHS
jgi:hypothetical protein